MRAQCEDLRQGRDWSPSSSEAGNVVETLTIHDGITLVLSRIDTGDECHFHYVEPEDMFGIGFHLRGGSRFEMETRRFETRPLEAWAGAAPRNAISSFVLPRHGFRTVSIRFVPEAASDLLQRHGHKTGIIADLIRMADREVATARLAPLDATAAQTVEAMFSSPYVGGTRTLFLESCALALLAAQFDAERRLGLGGNATTRPLHLEKMLVARDWLDEHIIDPPTIGALARLIGTNECTLKRVFKHTFGTTVFGYVRQRRMERAAAELHAGRSVGETAYAVGYVCPRCFADAFRRSFGILPSEVTRGALADIPAHHG